MAEANWVYNENVKDHFMNPRNILDDPETYEDDGRGMTGNIKCGDEMLFVIKVDKEKGIISDCKWKTFGCASAIASTSKLSEMVIGMKVEDAYRIQPDQIISQLGGLPDKKIHCSVLGDKALRAAIDDYYRRNGMEDRIRTTKAMVVCNCMNVTDHDIEEAVLDGARDYQTLQERTKIGTVCGECKEETSVLMNSFIEKYYGKQ
ncbi:iron-sulfur cluster assembly scaffold protein [bacterium]|nr:iron-sulfur cluster assembly scaffold protein [bacterium]